MNDEPTSLGSVIDPWYEALHQALRDSDAPALELLMTGDVVWMIANEPTLKGPRDVRMWFEEYFKNFKVEELAENQRSVIVADKWAFEWGVHSVKIRPRNGNVIEDEGRFLHVWKNVDRRWKLARLMWNSSRPIGAALNRFLATMNRPQSG